MVLRFRRHRREHGQEAEKEPQAPTPETEEEIEAPESFQSAEGGEAPVISDALPLAESDAATPSPSPKPSPSDSLSLLDALLRLHGAEDIDSLADAADQLARTYLNGTHLLVLVVDRGGSFRLRAVKSGATATLLEKLNDTLGIDVGRESPPPHRGRIAKIWLDDTASPQAVSLADFWGGLAGEEACWRAEKAMGISQVTAIRLASPEEPLGIALFLSHGDPPYPAMLDAVGRHLTVALASLLNLEKARQFGSIDPVRWIPDHSEFTRQLSREVSRAHRYEQPVSIALLVVDNFDTLRLEYGWTVANRLLRSVSSALAGCLRQSDFLGSYRHNGFGAILMQSSVEAASEAASRLREAAMGVRTLEGEDSPLPECVVATASYPKDGDDADALLAAAESRLLPKRRHSTAAA
jgi:diguanylate cyclase (GGDEF)-like protein